MNLTQLKQTAIQWVHSEGNYRKYKIPDKVISNVLVQPDYTSIWGIDVSHWDGNVNLSVTKALGASFVFIKAIDGTLITKNWLANRARAIAANLPQSTYGWLYPNNKLSCKLQAQTYAGLLNQYPPDLPPAIDFEWTTWGGVSANPTYSDLDIWVTEFNQRFPRKPILYTAAGFTKPYGAIPAALKAKFDSLWVAHYNTTNPLMPSGFAAGEWSTHQHTSSGDAMLIAPNDVDKRELDLNRIKDRTTYDRMTGLTPPPNGDNTMPDIFVNKVLSSALNGRSAPDAGQNNVIIGFAQGDILICDAEQLAGGSSWRRVRACIRGGANYPLPIGDIWASDGSAGSLQGELTAFETAGNIDLTALSVHASLSFDINGVTYELQNGELTRI